MSKLRCCLAHLLALTAGMGLLGCNDEPMFHAEYEPRVPGRKMNAKCDPTWPGLTIGPQGTTADVESSAAKVRIDDADYLPPGLAFNTWQISILDDDGEGMPSAHLNWACAWMEVHGHGSNPKAINALGPGRFELKSQNLAMYGPWYVRLWVDTEGTGPEYLPQEGTGVVGGHECDPTNGTSPQYNTEFKFCVPEDVAERE